MTEAEWRRDLSDMNVEPESLHDPLARNVEAILAMDSEEARQGRLSHKFLEQLGQSFEKPLFIGLIALFVASWIIYNLFGGKAGFLAFDHPPFPWLQGIVSLASLVTMVVVLIKQNSKARRDRRRDHLQLQLIMLTERKIAKTIGLMEELRRDLPSVGHRHDPEAEVLRQATHPQTVIDTIEQQLNVKK